MNSTRRGASAGKIAWRRILVSACVLLGGQTLFAAPRHSETPAQKAPPAVAESDSLPDGQQAPKDLLLSPADEKKADALAAYMQGIADEDDGDMDQALADYEKVLSFDPGYSDLAGKVGLECARRGDVSQGIEILKDAIKAQSKEPLLYLYLSELYAKYLKKPDIAAKYAAQAVELDPTNLGAYLSLFRLDINAGEPKKAEQILDRAAKSQSTDAQFWLQLGELYSKLYIKDDGSSRPEDLKKLNALYQKALTLGDDDTDVMTKVADYYVASRQVKQAVPLYLKVIDAKKKAGDNDLASVREKLAQSFLVDGQREEAIAMLEQLKKENPLNNETYEFLGEILKISGDEEKSKGREQDGDLDYEKSLANFEQGLLLNPNPLNYLHVAIIQLDLKKNERAVQTLTEARKKYPSIPEITYQLAVALSEEKKHQEAITCFEEAVQEAENTKVEMLDGGFYLSFGAAADRAGLREKAVEMLKKSIQLDESDPASAAQACNYLGFMWVDRGEHLDEAGDLIKRAVEVDPTNAAYVDSLGWYYYKKGDFPKALEELKKAIETIKPEDAPVVYDHLGDAYQKVGKAAEALECWRKSLSLDKDNKEVADKIEGANQKVTSEATPPVEQH